MDSRTEPGLCPLHTNIQWTLYLNDDFFYNLPLHFEFAIRSDVGGNVGPSGVRALPLAAGINKGGHYFR